MDKSYQKFIWVGGKWMGHNGGSNALCRSPWGAISSILRSFKQFIKVELGEGTKLAFGMTSG